MGQPKTIAEGVVGEALALVTDIQQALRDGQVTVAEARQIREQAELVHDLAVVADNRIKLIRTAITDVVNERTIGGRCRAAGYPATAFDLPLEAA